MPPHSCLVLLSKEEVSLPTDIIVADIAGWTPTWLAMTCSRGGIRTWLVSLFSVLCHIIYRTMSGFFKTRVGMSVGAAVTAATGAQGKI